MNRKLLVAAALCLSSAYVFACGDKKPANDPSKTTASATVSESVSATSAEPTTSTSETASSAPVASSSEPPPPPPPPKTLYERIGKEQYDKSVDDFMAALKKDKKLGKKFASLFKNTKLLEEFKKDLHDQLCHSTGGKDACPEDKNKALTEAFKKSKIKLTKDDFAGMEAELKKAFEAHKETHAVTAEEEAELLKAFEGMKADFGL